MRIEHIYVASDGERCRLSVDVTTPDDDPETARRLAMEYFETYGYRVVESAKAANMWPLPPDHPNA